ncbi:virulence factor TspB C-terminal domain-related protein [Pseudomonas aeruginosa]|uniref:virulence factor TspB C-terminal domain-related protein n=2 Tax=Pseudomonas aeruginosa TaxID=287 RepID=UPI00287CAAA3|nr:virulence factor TspB C-terminal domain-related protein [Pseudomonas aeruginosa]MDS9631987.1 virulence factor TspB C-terminal domain-related protein [Pseudomonas aeruginosa]MDS9688045.1 virulence factor TspB C-terminal domain-related protein [Pseudomonas aeruginosa]MDS9707523.1 virulence factor TspB C-terminal domain-related protein [Pseudomonas aeruginosa]MDS9752160.1 virulence factor TspB C-terminal domain-related protein [Pseudomonas aeruginosa]MDS9771880.1 virulence factor TspB C-termin
MRNLIFFLSLLLSGYSVAAGSGYTWSTVGFAGQYVDPAAACEAARVKSDESKDWNYVEARVASLDGDSGYCYIKYVSRTDPSVVNICNDWKCPNFRLVRNGDGCKLDSETYNPATGMCESSDKCKDTFGKEVYTDFQVGTVKDGHFTDPKSPPASLCVNSCLYTSPATTGSGNGYRMGQNFEVFVRYSYLGNASSCEQGETPNPPSDRSPSGKSDENCKPVEDAEGRKKLSCLKTDSYQNPGNLNCGMANGQLVCVPGKPSPNKNDTTTKTDITETTNPDGSKDTTTTTETTVTTCSGMNSCNTTTTTSTTNNKTNSDGTDGGSSTECKGPACKPSGEGAGGDSEGEEKEEEKESKVSGDESCDAVIACDGDAIQCAMLKQEKKQTCAWDYEKAKGTIESEIAKPEYQLTETTINTGELFNAGISASRWLPSACPAPKVISLSSGPSQTFSWEPECQMASSLAPIIVGLASLFFAVYVGRSIGG